MSQLLGVERKFEEGEHKKSKDGEHEHIYKNIEIVYGYSMRLVADATIAFNNEFSSDPEKELRK